MRWAIIILLFAVGAVLATNPGGIYFRLVLWPVRKLAVTDFLRANAPQPVYFLEQYLLLHHGFTGYFAILGLLAGLMLRKKNAALGVALPLGHTLHTAKMGLDVLRRFAASTDASLVPFIPWSMILASVADPILFMAAVTAGNRIRQRNVPQCTLRDTLATVFLCSLVALGSIYESTLALSATMVVASCYCWWRLHNDDLTNRCTGVTDRARI
jgi:hypothetical protein